MNKTKIIATLGPGTESEEKIIALIRAGMNVARINLSHGDRNSHAQFIKLVKEARRVTGTDTAILLDTRGPEIRVNDLDAPIDLRAGQTLTITSNHASCSADRIGVNYPGLLDDIQPGNRILLDDGKLVLVVERIENGNALTRILVSGRLSSRKRVSLPDCTVNLPSLSDKDRDDIAFGVQQEVDFIAASFVRKADDVWAVRKILEENGGNQAIIAKIENRQGVENLQEILQAAEGLMVARGDLGVEMPAEEVPVIQKRIIRAANLVGKPVITATQMLESMITSPSPTRAEASDVTNAIYDGTDAVMLSAETAVGAYPTEAILFLVRCATITENSLDYEAILAAGLKHKRQTVTDAISYACCATAADLGAAAIITSTTSGSTARMVARHRPKTPIIAVSPNLESLRKLQLIRGVTTIFSECASTMDEQLDRSTNAARQAGLIQNGDLIIITAGMPIGMTGNTNMLKVRTVEDLCFTGQGASGATAEGKIHIIKQKSDWLDLPEEAIVVVNATDESMQAYLRQVRGIITEQAGLTSHAAIVGRELNIPVIGNVLDATTLFKNGQTVSIDGRTGRISYGSVSSR
ncbi:pyruvate kinase [Desulfocastanea catecholica]